MVEAPKTALEGGGLGKSTGVRGVRGVQFWRKIADPAPADESDLEFVREFTRARMTLDYQMSLGSQTVYYQARWVSTRGEVGRHLSGALDGVGTLIGQPLGAPRRRSICKARDTA